MEFLYEYGLFLAKSITFIVAIFFILTIMTAVSSRGKASSSGELSIKNLSKEIKKKTDYIKKSLLSKQEKKAFEAAEKAKNKSGSSEEVSRRNKMFVLSFNGNVHADEVSSLREEITAILAVASKDDEVLIKLESPGGVVHGYGLASSQIARLRDAGIKVTVSVDKVAASGGYMMACVADKIVAAPFAIVGSIGVVAEVPNINKLLKKHDIDIEQHTAGNYKRTLTLMGENTEEGRAKFKEDLTETHRLFKNWIKEYRPDLEIEKVATGEHWYGQQAIDLGLIDEIGTSDDYIVNSANNFEMFNVKFQAKKSVAEKLGVAASTTVSTLFNKLYSLNYLSHK